MDADVVSRHRCPWSLCSLLADSSKEFPLLEANGVSMAAMLWGTRYSPLDQITQDNAKNLQVVWRWKSQNMGPTPQAAWEVTPLMVGGKIYVERRVPLALLSRPTPRRARHSGTYHGDDTAERGQVRPVNRGLAYWSDGQGDDRILVITPEHINLWR